MFIYTEMYILFKQGRCTLSSGHGSIYCIEAPDNFSYRNPTSHSQYTCLDDLVLKTSADL